MNLIQPFSKDYYIEELKNAGEYLKQKAEDILLDFDTDRIKEINVSIDLKATEITTVKVNKEYLPIIIDKEESKCQLQEK